MEDGRKGEEVEQINSYLSRISNTTKYMLPKCNFIKVTVDLRGVSVYYCEIYKPICHWRAYITGYTSVLKYVWFY